MRQTEEPSDDTTSGPAQPADPGIGSDTPSAGPVVSLPSACSTIEGTPTGSSGSHSTRSSSSRSSVQSRHTSRHHHRRRRRFRFKQKERNFLAAVCSMVVIVTLCTALAEPSWFYVRGGGCRDIENSPTHSLGVYQYFYLGEFDDPTLLSQKDKSMQPKYVYHYGAYPADILVDCVSPKIVLVMRSIIALCFIGITFSLMAFFLDLAGPSTRILKFLRRNAVFNIFTVLVCVTVNGFSFMVTQLLDTLQNITKTHRYSKVEVRFDVSFYLVAGAGGMSVIAATCNLLRRYPPHTRDRDEEQRENLLEDYDGMDFGHAHGPDFYSPMTFLPPPPPYSP